MATMGERIKLLRRLNGMTQTDLAGVLGVTKGTVSSWETNTRVPSVDSLYTMSDLFSRSIDYILGRSDDGTPRAQNSEGHGSVEATNVEDDLTEYALKYARLDIYGRSAVEAIVRAEYNRCRDESKLAPSAAYYGGIIKRVLEPGETCVVCSDENISKNSAL